MGHDNNFDPVENVPSNSGELVGEGELTAVKGN
jgi:hypothetical protein